MFKHLVLNLLRLSAGPAQPTADAAGTSPLGPLGPLGPHHGRRLAQADGFERLGPAASVADDPRLAGARAARVIAALTQYAPLDATAPPATGRRSIDLPPTSVPEQDGAVGPADAP